jgi:hypothetical protein
MGLSAARGTRYLSLLLVSVVVIPLSLLGGTAVADASHINRDILWTDTTGLAYEGGLAFYGGSNNSLTPCDRGFNNPLCNITQAKLQVINVLPPCETDLSSPCLEGVWVDDGSGNWVSGEYIGDQSQTGGLYTFSAQPAYDLAASRNANFYRFPGVTHGQGDLFQVDPLMNRGIDQGIPQDPTSLSVSIRPVYKQPSPGDPTVCIEPNWGFSGGYDCWQVATESQTQRFKVVLRLPKLPQGWVTGRLLGPEISFEDLGPGQKQRARITLIGGQLATPMLHRDYWNDLPDSKATWDRLNPVFGLPWSFNFSAGPVLGPTSINQFLGAVKIDPTLDVADGVQAKWVADFNWQSHSKVNGCPSGKFLGYVGSNALTYASSVPTFDPVEGALVYKIASPHSLPGGKEFAGVYELLVDENYARCLWGLGTIPIQASVSVVNADGTTKVATTVIGISGGMVHFEAAGFTFSETSIIAKITRPPAAPKSSPPPATTNPITRKLITCVKGKFVKKVISTNPKCPTGFKKK